MNTITERLLHYMSLKGLNPNKITVEAKLSVGLIGKAIKKNSSLNSDTIEKILHTYKDINPEWFILGIGDVLKTKNTNNLTVLKGKEKGKEKELKQNIQKTLPNKNLIPFYDSIVVGGTSQVAIMGQETEAVEYIDAGDWFRDATAAMRVHNDSMAPDYKGGSIVALKKVNDKRLIVYGQTYVIETSEYRVIKNLQRSDDDTCWLCCSINEEIYESTGKLINEPFTVPINAVRRLFRVLGSVTRTESSRIVLNRRNN